MLQPAQNAPFALEPLFATLPHQRDIENLHRYAPFKSSVVSFRQPDGAHSPVADLRYQGVNTQSQARQAIPKRSPPENLPQTTSGAREAVFQVDRPGLGSRSGERTARSSAGRLSSPALRQGVD